MSDPSASKDKPTTEFVDEEGPLTEQSLYAKDESDDSANLRHYGELALDLLGDLVVSIILVGLLLLLLLGEAWLIFSYAAGAELKCDKSTAPSICMQPVNADAALMTIPCLVIAGILFNLMRRLLFAHFPITTSKQINFLVIMFVLVLANPLVRHSLM